MANFIVPLLLIVIFVSKGESLRCWTCTSDNPGCGDPFAANDHFLTHCYPESYHNVSESVCYKMKNLNDAESIERGCTTKSSIPGNSCSAYPDQLYCETCDYDGCNSAAAVGKTMALVAPVILLFK